MLIAIFLITLIGGIFLFRSHIKRKRRQELLASRLSDRQREIVLTRVPLLRQLPHTLMEKLEGKILLFLDQVDISGCNGLEVTEEMRLSIAAQACLLIVNNDAWYKTCARS